MTQGEVSYAQLARSVLIHKILQEQNFKPFPEKKALGGQNTHKQKKKKKKNTTKPKVRPQVVLISYLALHIKNDKLFFVKM